MVLQIVDRGYVKEKYEFDFLSGDEVIQSCGCEKGEDTPTKFIMFGNCCYTFPAYEYNHEFYSQPRLVLFLWKRIAPFGVW